MCFMILETVEVLVSLVAHIALVRFFLLHTDCAWVWLIIVRVQYRESTVSIFLQSLVLVTMSFVVFQTISIAI